MATTTATTTVEQTATLQLPEGLPKIDLPKISLAKLLDGDADQARTIFDICTRTGFFYLNLMDHAKGQELWESACLARQIGADVMSTLPMEEKDKFLKRPEVGILDRGFQSTIRDEHGQTKFVESINIPHDELFATQPTGWTLPPWLSPHEAQFKSVMTAAHSISTLILRILEQELQLPAGALVSLHQLQQPSHSFLRILRYPALAQALDQPRFFAHRDIVSVAMLFTWVGGLQIPCEAPAYVAGRESEEVETEDSWRWVEPLPGHVVVNLGDAMPIFTNGLLKSGKHRVVMAPQRGVDRCCVLVSARPAHETPMRALESAVIPKAEEGEREVESAREWGDNCVKVFIRDKVKGNKG